MKGKYSQINKLTILTNNKIMIHTHIYINILMQRIIRFLVESPRGLGFADSNEKSESILMVNTFCGAQHEWKRKKLNPNN